MGLSDFGESPETNPEKVINERIPDNLVPLALEINNTVQQVVGENNYRISGSGDGVTYYPELTNHVGYAFMTVQPNRGSSYLYIHFDTSAKERVEANPILNSSIPAAQEIPSNWKWSGSFRLSIEVEHIADIDDDVQEAIEKSLSQLRR